VKKRVARPRGCPKKEFSPGMTGEGGVGAEPVLSLIRSVAS